MIGPFITRTGHEFMKNVAPKKIYGENSLLIFLVESRVVWLEFLSYLLMHPCETFSFMHPFWHRHVGE